MVLVVVEVGIYISKVLIVTEDRFSHLGVRRELSMSKILIVHKG